MGWLRISAGDFGLAAVTAVIVSVADARCSPSPDSRDAARRQADAGLPERDSIGSRNHLFLRVSKMPRTAAVT